MLLKFDRFFFYVQKFHGQSDEFSSLHEFAPLVRTNKLYKAMSRKLEGPVEGFWLPAILAKGGTGDLSITVRNLWSDCLFWRLVQNLQRCR